MAENTERKPLLSSDSYEYHDCYETIPDRPVKFSLGECSADDDGAYYQNNYHFENESYANSVGSVTSVGTLDEYSSDMLPLIPPRTQSLRRVISQPSEETGWLNRLRSPACINGILIPAFFAVFWIVIGLLMQAYTGLIPHMCHEEPPATTVPPYVK